MKKVSLAQLSSMISALKRDCNIWNSRFLDSNVYNEYDGEPAYPLSECIEALEEINEKIVRYKTLLANANCSVMVDFDEKRISLNEAILYIEVAKSNISSWNRLDAKNRKTIIIQDNYNETLDTIVKSYITSKQKEQIIIKLQKSLDNLKFVVEQANNTNFVEI